MFLWQILKNKFQLEEENKWKKSYNNECVKCKWRYIFFTWLFVYKRKKDKILETKKLHLEKKKKKKHHAGTISHPYHYDE